MKIAIHHRPNSYSEYWIDYCKRNNYQFKIVNAYANDILDQLSDCDAFMWHFSHKIYKDHLFAKQLIYVIQKHLGKITYPAINSCWHFDDKIGQRYLLETISTQTIPTSIFYSYHESFQWIKHTSFPKVFKLRSGVASSNVQLVENIKQAKNLSKRAFCNGFQKNSHLIRIAKRWKQYRNGGCTLKWFLKGLITRCSYKERFDKEEIGYIYFQDFVPDNNYDTRVFVIGNRAVAVKRLNRENDFRASGSGMLIYDNEQIDIEYIKTAFEINRQLNAQSLVFDFMKRKNGQVVLSEISYNCGIESNISYPGFWTNDLQWHNSSKINIFNWIIEDVIEKVLNKS